MLNLLFPEKVARTVFFPDSLVFSWLRVKKAGYVPLVRFFLVLGALGKP